MQLRLDTHADSKATRERHGERRHDGPGEDFRIWDGVYGSFADAGGSPAVFQEQLWVERSKQRAFSLCSAAREDLELGRSVSSVNASVAYALPVFAALAQLDQAPGERLEILDFGGAVGFSFHSLLDAIGNPDALHLNIIDNANICEVGREIFHDEPRISFHSELPEPRRVDVVHFGSSIQCVDDWRSVIRKVAVYEPKYIIFDDIPAGDIPTFVTLQNYYDDGFPHHFFNTREFVDAVHEATGYLLCFKARYIGTFLGKRGPMPMDHFPPEYRLENACNFVFARPSGHIAKTATPSGAAPRHRVYSKVVTRRRRTPTGPVDNDA